MAFPTSVGNFVDRGCGGPFLSSGGNVYIIGTAPGDTTKLSAYKATDPTVSFSNVGTDFAMTSGSGIGVLAATQVGDNIHVATHDAASATTNQIRYHIFSMSSDTWTTTNEAIKGTNFSTVSASTTIYGLGISLRSDGDVIVIYQGPLVANMGSDRERVYYARREAGVWTVDVALDNGGATHWYVGGVVIGSSDRMHLFFQDNGAADGYQRCLRSANTLETFPTAFELGLQGSSGAMKARGASYDSAGTIKVRFPDYSGTANEIDTGECDSADTPTMSNSSDITGASSASQNANRSSFAANGTTLWHAYADTAGDIDAQSNANGGGWSAPAVFYAGTVQEVYTNVYTRNGDTVLAIVFDETGTKYTEKVLSTAGNALSATATATLTGSGAATAAVPFTAAAAATLTGRGAATATANLSAIAAATLAMVGEGNILTAAEFQSAAIATLAAQGKATAAADLLATAAATLTAQGKSTASAALQAAAAATLTAQSQATAAAALLASAAATLTGSGASVASASWQSAAAATLAMVGEASAQSAAALQAPATAALTMQGQATAAADLLAAATATLTAQGGAIASANWQAVAAATLTAQGQAIAAANLLASAAATLTLVGQEVAAAAGDGAFEVKATAALTAQGATFAAAAAQIDASASLIMIGLAPGAATRVDYGLPKRRHLKRLAEDDAEVLRLIKDILPYLESESHGYH